MTDAVSISIVTSVSAVVMAGISAFFSYKAKTISETTSKAVDGHLTEFKAMAEKTFTAEGVLREKREEQLRKADAAIAKAEGVNQRMTETAGPVPANANPVTLEVTTAVKQAVVESVKAPVKEAVMETSFTATQIDQIIEALNKHRGK